MMRRFAVLALLLAAPGALQAQEAVIRIWGTPAMLGIAQRWGAAFERTHPGVRIEYAMKGSDSAIHGLVGDAADIALMGRENDVVDDNGFARPREYPATRIEIATGSLTTPGKSDAVAVLVHADNPLASLSLGQLARILDCGDQPRPIANWGELGLTGDWAGAPIHVHSYDFATRTGSWVQDRITGKDRRMCWDRIAEHGDRRRLDGTITPAADEAGDAARGDRHALVIANSGQAHGGLRLVALSDGGAPVLPTSATVQARTYPLTRRAYAFVDRAPGKPLAPLVRDFLRFALSAEGQALLAADAGYLPLDAATAEAQLTILESSQ